jgi:hypothetical protein
MTPSTNHTARITIDYTWGRVEGPLLVVYDALQVGITTFQTTDRGCVQAVRVPMFYFDLDHRGRAIMSPGLVPRVQAALEEGGWDVEVRDQREQPPTPAPRPDKLTKVTAEDVRLIAGVREHYRGQIQVSGTEGLISAMARICELFATENVLIQVSTRQRARQIWLGLERYLGAEVKVLIGNWRYKPSAYRRSGRSGWRRRHGPSRK